MTDTGTGTGGETIQTRTVLLPDLGEELTSTLTALEELLIALLDDEDAPAILADGTALGAVRRLWDAIAPTQGRRAREAGRTGRLLAVDGRHEHRPLRIVQVDAADVAALSRAAQALGVAGDWIREVLEEFGRAHYPDERDHAVALISRAAALAGLLDLADTEHTQTLKQCLGHVDPATDIVLTTEGDDAYERTAGRLNRMWGALDPWAY